MDDLLVEEGDHILIKAKNGDQLWTCTMTFESMGVMYYAFENPREEILEYNYFEMSEDELLDDFYHYRMEIVSEEEAALWIMSN